MRRFWIPNKFINNNLITIQEEYFHHICRVCRMKIKSKFSIITENQNSFLIEIQEIKKDYAIAKIIKKIDLPTIQSPFLHLFISIPKIVKLDFIIEKCVELGVSTITPIFTTNSFIRDPKIINEKKFLRWQKIIQQACKQSARIELLKINPPIFLQEVLKNMTHNDTLKLFLYEGKCKTNLKEILYNYKKTHKKNPANIDIFIGSEGGFTIEEVQLFQKNNLESVSLGPQILKVDTACISTLSILNYEFKL